MQSLAVGAIMIGLIFFWMMTVYEPSQRDQLQAEAVALNFVLYRNAVNRYAFEHKTEGSVPMAELALPLGLSSMPWQNQIVWEGDELRCYVFGPASTEVITAVLRLLRGSAAVGWNNNGRMVRSGPEHALPGFIADRTIVSVIIVDGPL